MCSSSSVEGDIAYSSLQNTVTVTFIRHTVYPIYLSSVAKYWRNVVTIRQTVTEKFDDADGIGSPSVSKGRG